jgi:hypothetical protein
MKSEAKFTGISALSTFPLCLSVEGTADGCAQAIWVEFRGVGFLSSTYSISSQNPNLRVELAGRERNMELVSRMQSDILILKNDLSVCDENGYILQTA